MFRTKNGTALSAGNVRWDFRKILKGAELVDAEWTPGEMRHSFASPFSDSGVPIEHISRLVGHANTVVTETVHRLQIRPVVQEGATAMDGLFGSRQEAWSPRQPLEPGFRDHALSVSAGGAQKIRTPDILLANRADHLGKRACPRRQASSESP
ncbi:tyrosine-type recombinase/integrase [Sphaerisporangium dianthi]|uniref:Tyrosine-type recombinase/integrase n=1 Tax=Sphaerisporangium dianthi TaxID=1436120 RepID=A0ABV9CE71_9ACTN